MALMTLDDLKLHLGVSGSGDDDLLEELQDAAEEFVTVHCGRAFEGGTFAESFAGGSRMLVLRNFPVTAVSSLKVDPTRTFGPDTERDTATYVLHADRGVIENLNGPFVGGAAKGAYPQAVAVEYETAMGVVPAAVERATADLVGHWYRQTKTYEAAGQLNVMEVASGTDTTRYPWGQSGGFHIPPGVLEVLAPYQNPRV
jgi:uncharacterized phiE125 gp8 family phage protein